jgi:hypothetical protein
MKKDPTKKDHCTGSKNGLQKSVLSFHVKRSSGFNVVEEGYLYMILVQIKCLSEPKKCAGRLFHSGLKTWHKNVCVLKHRPL